MLCDSKFSLAHSISLHALGTKRVHATVRQPQWQLGHHPQCAAVQGDVIPENSPFDNHIIMRDLFHSRKGFGFPYIYDTTSILMPKLTPPSNLNINRVTCMVLLCHSVYRVIYQAGRLRGDQAYASRPSR